MRELWQRQFGLKLPFLSNLPEVCARKIDLEDLTVLLAWCATIVRLRSSDTGVFGGEV